MVMGVVGNDATASGLFPFDHASNAELFPIVRRAPGNVMLRAQKNTIDIATNVMIIGARHPAAMAIRWERNKDEAFR